MSISRDLLARRLRAPQEKAIHDLNQMLADQAAENINVVTSNLRGYAIKPSTTTKSRDKHYAYVRPFTEGVNYYTGKYPDYDNCRLFIRSENFGQVFDYSLQSNQAKVLSDMMIQEVVIREDENNIIGGEFVSYFNGSHYVNVKDNRKLRLKDIVVDTPEKDGFSFVRRFNPLRYGNSNQDSIILAQKVDSSQNQYGYSLNLDDQGNLYFYVSYNYRLYFAKLDAAFDPIDLGNVDFYFQNFNKRNFKTEYDSVQEWANTLMYDVACSFDFTTKECKIRLRFKDKDGIEQVRSISSVDQMPSNLQLHLPLQEGKWSDIENVALDQVYDTSSNEHIGTIVNPDRVTWQDDNTLLLKGIESDGASIEIPNHASFNTFTEMTLAFWYKPITNNINTNRLFMIGYDNTAHVKVHRSGGANDLSFSIALNSNGTGSEQVEYNNAFPVLDQWYFVTCKWKTGEELKISIDNGTDVLDNTTITGTFTELTRPLDLLDWREDNGIMLNLMFFNKQISSLEQTDLYNFGPHLAQFPVNKEPQRTPSEEPEPITNPFAILYDLSAIVSPTSANYTFLNNPSAANPYISKYNCVEGTPESIPKVTPYNVPDGVSVVGSPFVQESELTTSDNSNGVLSSSNNNYYGVQVSSISSGRGQALYNKAFTKVGFWLRKVGTVGGTLYCRIWNVNTGAVIGNIGSMTNLNTTLTSSYAYYEFTNLSNTAKITGVDQMIGLEYVWSSSGQEINVQRNSGSIDSTILQGYYDGSWKEHTGYDPAYRVFTGQGTSSSTPFYFMSYGNYKRVAEYVGTGDPLIGKAPSELTCKLYRDSSATQGTLVWKIWKANGTIITLAAAAKTVSSITTSTSGTIYTFEDLENPYTLAAGDRIGIEWVSQPFSSAKVYVMTNYGNHSPTTDTAKNHKSTTSYFSLYQSSWTNTTSYDLSGTISYGGYSFSAIFKFTSAVTRVGQRATNNSAPFWNQLLTRLSPLIKRTGTIPAPSTITATIRKQSDNSILKTIGSVDANSIGTSAFEPINFTNIGSDYYIQSGDYVCFQLSSCDASNYIEFSINKDVISNSTLIQHVSSVTSDLAQYDLSGIFYIGGQIDESSRIRVGQYINTQNSLFMTAESNKITDIIIPMYKVGSPTGQVYFNIRDENDVPVKTLGQIAASSLSTNPASPTFIQIQDLTNTYILSAKNMISIEFEEGDQDNRVGVQIKTSSYDSTNSYLARYNGIEYDYNTAVKLVSLMKTGGDTYVPDPSDLPPIMPQSDADLYLGISGDKEGEFTIEIFDLFVFATELLTDDEFDNFYFTRNDFESNASEEILLTNHSFINVEE